MPSCLRMALPFLILFFDPANKGGFCWIVVASDPCFQRKRDIGFDRRIQKKKKKKTPDRCQIIDCERRRKCCLLFGFRIHQWPRENVLPIK